MFHTNKPDAARAGITKRTLLSSLFSAGLWSLLTPAMLRAHPSDQALDDRSQIPADPGGDGSCKVNPAAGRMRAEFVEPSVEGTGSLLYRTDQNGNKQEHLGYVLACPQRCASRIPVGRQGSPSFHPALYPTSESMKEIFFVAKEVFGGTYTKQKLFEAGRIIACNRRDHESPATGCGHVSRSVLVTKIAKAQRRYKEVSYGTNMFAIAAAGKTVDPNTGLFSASEIWVSHAEWTPSAGNPVQKVYDDIGNRTIKINRNC